MNGQSRDTGNIDHKTQEEDKQQQKHNTEKLNDQQYWPSKKKTRMNLGAHVR